MAWSLERKRFVGALCLFLLWVVLLGVLAMVSAYRPANRAALSDQPAATGEPASAGDEK